MARLAGIWVLFAALAKPSERSEWLLALTIHPKLLAWLFGLELPGALGYVVLLWLAVSSVAVTASLQPR